jgi:hypothetical protein
MEIPAALHGLECQYENILSHFHFGKFDPVKQGLAFQKKIEEYLSKEEDQLFFQNILFINFDNSQTLIDADPNRIFQQTENFLQILWKNLCSSIEDN